MISSNLNRFNDISAPEMPLLLDEHRLTSPPLSPESASSQSLHQYTEQYDNQLSYHKSLITQTSFNGTSSEAKSFDFDEEQELWIRVDGIPNSGAKSRVETQIKLLISLTTKHGEKVPCWSYIRITESLLARSKLRKNQQQKLLDGSAATMVSDDSKVLELDARVVCETDEKKRIQMCQGCVRRERKRAERKKDAKPSNYNLNTKAVKEAFERDRKRVLLFNCESLINFNTGEAIVPTRITCYCRHHNEPIGFRVKFTLRNNKGVIIATGQSPPIMVTDDHKGSKELPPSISDTRKITRAASADSDKEESSNALATPASSRKNSACEIDLINNNVSQSCLPDSNTSSLVFGHPGEAIPSPSNTITTDYITQSPSTPTLAGIWQDMTMNPTSYGPFQLPITDKLNLHHCSTNTNLTNSPLPPINQFSSPIRQKFRRIVAPTDTCLINPLQEQHCHPDSTSRYMISSPPIIITSAQAAMVPVLDHIEPPLGPTTGGTEIAIFGQNFDTGLIVMFGDCAATTLSCSSNTIICLLPIADKPGPVVLSFKEHSFLRTCPEPPLFSYYETSHQDMIDLALEASGNNFISAVEKQQLQECAFSQRNIEMQVIHMLSQQQQYMDETKSNIGGQNLLHLAAHLNYGGLAHLLLTHNSALVHTLDRNGLTPLHFACKSKSTFVIEILLKVGAHVGAMSSFGTPLQIVSFMLDDSEYAALQREISSGQPKVNPVSWLPNIFVYAASEFHQRNSVPFTNVYPILSSHQHDEPLLYHHHHI